MTVILAPRLVLEVEAGLHSLPHGAGRMTTCHRDNHGLDRKLAHSARTGMLVHAPLRRRQGAHSRSARMLVRLHHHAPLCRREGARRGPVGLLCRRVDGKLPHSPWMLNHGPLCRRLRCDLARAAAVKLELPGLSVGRPLLLAWSEVRN